MVKVMLKDVAEQAGVSRATASMALNNYENISPETRERVVLCARRLGYLRQQKRRQSSSPRTDTGTLVFVMCGDRTFDTNPYYASIASGAMRVAKAARRKMVVCHWLPDEMRSRTAPVELGESTVAGAIVTGWYDPAALECVLRTEVPVVLVDTNVVHPACDWVGPDNHEAVRLAYGHLRELGHRKIVALIGQLEHADWQQKRDAFMAMTAADSLAGVAIPAGGRSLPEMWDEARARVPGVTAVLATWDDAALGLLSLLHARGIRCPEEVSMIGIDDVQAGRSSAPPLTTVNTDQQGMGQLAVLQLLQRIAHPEAPVVRAMPRAELVLRSSCKPLRGE